MTTSNLGFVEFSVRLLLQRIRTARALVLLDVRFETWQNIITNDKFLRTCKEGSLL